MNTRASILILSFLATLWSTGFAISPNEVEVSHELLEDPIIEVEPSTDLADGIVWNARSDQPFVTIINPEGTAPESINVRIIQVALGSYLAAGNT